jgi:hypothetical protein
MLSIKLSSDGLPRLLSFVLLWSYKVDILFSAKSVLSGFQA